MLSLLYFFPNLDLRCTTCDEVLDAIEKTKQKYCEVNFNRLTKKKKEKHFLLKDLHQEIV